jgi:microcystin-dependent protein
VSRITYPDLFSVIGVMHGSGNGNDTFNLPDFRTRFPLGSNDSQLVSGGASSHVMVVAELPVHSHDQGSLITLTSGDHTHALVDPGHDHGGLTGSGPFSSGSFAMVLGGGSGNDGGVHTHTISSDITGITIDSNGSHTHTVQGSTGSQGLGQPIDMMPPYQTIYYIIRA